MTRSLTGHSVSLIIPALIFQSLWLPTFLLIMTFYGLWVCWTTQTPTWCFQVAFNSPAIVLVQSVSLDSWNACSCSCSCWFKRVSSRDASTHKGCSFLPGTFTLISYIEAMDIQDLPSIAERYLPSIVAAISHPLSWRCHLYAGIFPIQLTHGLPIIIQAYQRWDLSVSGLSKFLDRAKNPPALITDRRGLMRNAKIEHFPRSTSFECPSD